MPVPSMAPQTKLKGELLADLAARVQWEGPCLAEYAIMQLTDETAAIEGAMEYLRILSRKYGTRWVAGYIVGLNRRQVGELLKRPDFLEALDVIREARTDAIELRVLRDCIEADEVPGRLAQMVLRGQYPERYARPERYQVETGGAGVQLVLTGPPFPEGVEPDDPAFARGVAPVEPAGNGNGNGKGAH